jgi:hypothetical protein
MRELLIPYILGAAVGFMIAYGENENDLANIAACTFAWPILLVVAVAKGVWRRLV